MSDWADEKEKDLNVKSQHEANKKAYIPPPEGFIMVKRGWTAQALRDIQRETAETCAKLAGMTIVVPKNGDCVLAVTKQLQDSVNAIKKRFNLLGDEQ